MEDEPENYLCRLCGYEPFIRLYEEEEQRLIYRQQIRHSSSRHPRCDDIEVTLEAEESQSVWDDFDAYRYYHALRFFKSLEGFYKGTLDLSGRHLHRFEQLMAIYHEIVQDLDRIRETVREEEFEDTDTKGRVRTYLEYVVTNEETWKQCRLKWKLPRVVDFGWLEDRLGKLAVIRQEAQETLKIQKLCLMNLPPELIHHVFHFADVQQARRLASTCQTMKQIGSSPQLYRTRSVSLHFADWDIIKQLTHEQLSAEFLDELAGEKTGDLASHVDFLTSRPDLARLIQTLIVEDHWNSDGREVPILRARAYKNPFYDSINHSMCSLLSACFGLTQITINHFVITSDWLEAISQLLKLHTIYFTFARIEDDTVEADIAHNTIPLAPQVLNVEWSETWNVNHETLSRESTGGGLWYTLPLLPNLVTFKHHAPPTPGTTWLPSVDIQDRSELLFQGLRKLALCLLLNDVPTLADWITQSELRHSTPCTLTHVKLTMHSPLPEGLALVLLGSLRSAPLQVLVLERIKRGSLLLIERIVQFFPDLVGLTLTQREGRLPRFPTNQLVLWPHPTGEYAHRFQGFRRLRYFGWNIHIPTYEYAPSAMLRWEAAIANDAVADSPSAVAVASGHENDEDEFEELGTTVARVFGCYCPTLEVMVVEGRISDVYSIDRGDGGKVKATMNLCSDGRNVWNLDEWNPGGYHRGWKHVAPVANVDDQGIGL
ncbi:hypothetical protein PM082_006397 [Marasmius tenuissimus]|nr:hypothetical protein PM082_006397 [Marasmius tenuissimus]